MIRSTFLAFCFIVLASNLDQTNGLAAIVRRVRNAGLFGIRRAQRTPRVVPNAPFVAPTLPAAKVDPAVNLVTTFDSFDADLYRREMTDLVYERNMQRLHVK
ncbi:hypothetical protein IV203_029696 [Nitzschia inconspicua]|uniref:Uncharacterized protein n=1 Tax=Nitzschia inconspicua TaxID=303405 RepID=A0A9K3LTW3_9STRA|nr:hypothetical protein IV203_029696 [Nitzschia inconspicua]